MKLKKLLILTYYWPPAGGAGVQRWLKFAKYLSLLGYELHIYTAQNPEAPANDSSLLLDVPESAIIIKKPIWEPFGIYKKITNKKGKFNAGFLTEDNANKTKWTEKASMFVRANVFVPDAKMFWIRPSVKFLKPYIIKNNIDFIISSGPPHSLHLIALKLKKQLKIKWLADFRDPWTNIDFYHNLPMLSMVDKRQHSLELEVLNKADKVIVVGEGMRKEFAEMISLKEKIHVISNGYDTRIRTNETLERKFTIVHIGSINADRSHESFYEAISIFLAANDTIRNQFKLKLIGKVDYKVRHFVSKYHLDDVVEYISYIPYNQISEIQERAHILYLPINNTPNAKGILTGKFFEYLAARRMILAQGPLDGDIATILDDMKSGMIFDYSDVIGIVEILNKEFLNYQNNEYIFEGGDIKKYSRVNLTKVLSELIAVI